MRRYPKCRYVTQKVCLKVCIKKSHLIKIFTKLKNCRDDHLKLKHIKPDKNNVRNTNKNLHIKSIHSYQQKRVSL